MARPSAGIDVLELVCEFGKIAWTSRLPTYCKRELPACRAHAISSALAEAKSSERSGEMEGSRSSAFG